MLTKPQVIINKEKKVVTTISINPIRETMVKVAKRRLQKYPDDMAMKKIVETVKYKTVTVSRCHPDDEFDPVVGVALSLAYNMFGSRTQFLKFVDTLMRDKK